MLELRTPTPPSWLEPVLADFDAFLVDHAACERKAAATGMSFVVRYPNRIEMLDPLIAFAREELEHFHIVYKIILKRGLTLAPDEKDAYVNALRALVRTGGDGVLLDRLLVAGVVEARGCERLCLVSEALEDPELRSVYLDLGRAESRHHALFFRIARLYFSEREVRTRADFFLDHEAEIVARLPHRAAVH